MVLFDIIQLISSGGKYTNMINIKHENENRRPNIVLRHSTCISKEALDMGH